MPQIDKPRLDGKIALVTGASRGIGRAIAQRLAAAGATIIVSSRSYDVAVRDEGTLVETIKLIEANGGRAIPLVADLERAEDRESLIPRAIEAAGGVDILVNNAGYAEFVTVDQMSDGAFDRTIDHYLRAPLVLDRAVIPHMREKGEGWIIHLGSATAQPPLKPYADFWQSGGAALYGAIKAAVHRLTQGLAAELVASNIAVNCVAPSTSIATPGSMKFKPAGYPLEDISYIAETALQLAYMPAVERTGQIAYSMHFPHAHGFAVYDVEGKEQKPPAEIPPHANPTIIASGEAM